MKNSAMPTLNFSREPVRPEGRRMRLTVNKRLVWPTNYCAKHTSPEIQFIACKINKINQSITHSFICPHRSPPSLTHSFIPPLTPSLTHSHHSFIHSPHPLLTHDHSLTITYSPHLHTQAHYTMFLPVYTKVKVSNIISRVTIIFKASTVKKYKQK